MNSSKMSIKRLRASTGTRLELWDTQLQRHVIASQHGVHRRGGGGGGGGVPNGQARIYQGNQIYGFSCPAFERGTTWISF